MKKILIYDSKEAIVEMIRETMISEGYLAKGVVFTADFIYTVQQYMPNLILMDYNLLSRFNGLELCHQIKTNTILSHIPVIMISAYPYSLDITNNKGPDQIINKPFSLQELTKQVENLLLLNN